MNSRASFLASGALRHRLLLLLLAPLLVLLLVSLFADYRTALEPSNAAYDHALAKSYSRKWCMSDWYG